MRNAVLVGYSVHLTNQFLEFSKLLFHLHHDELIWFSDLANEKLLMFKKVFSI